MSDSVQTFQELYEHVEDLLNDDSQTTLVKKLINNAYDQAIEAASFVSQGVQYTPTIANRWIYALGSDVKKPRTVRVVESDTNGTTDGVSANKLVDSTASFTADLIEKIVYNTTDDTTARVLAVDSATQLTLSADIFTSGEGYFISDGDTNIAGLVASEHLWEIYKSNRNETTSDKVQFYYINGTDVELYPTPSTSNQLLTITYEKEPTLLSADGDIPIMPRHQIVYLTYSALEFMFRKREEHNQANQYKALWNEALIDIQRFSTSKTTNMEFDLKHHTAVVTDTSKDKLITTSY